MDQKARSVEELEFACSFVAWMMAYRAKYVVLWSMKRQKEESERNVVQHKAKSRRDWAEKGGVRHFGLSAPSGLSVANACGESSAHEGRLSNFGL